MTELQYNNFLEAYTKEVLCKIIKADIRQRFPEPTASMYCQRLDDAKTFADFLESMVKQIRE